MTVEYDMELKTDMTKDEIEFQLNEGTWCANNAIAELQEMIDKDDAPCLCPVAEFEVVSL